MEGAAALSRHRSAHRDVDQRARSTPAPPHPARPRRSTRRPRSSSRTARAEPERHSGSRASSARVGSTSTRSRPPSTPPPRRSRPARSSAGGSAKKSTSAPSATGMTTPASAPLNSLADRARHQGHRHRRTRPGPRQPLPGRDRQTTGDASLLWEAHRVGIDHDSSRSKAHQPRRATAPRVRRPVLSPGNVAGASAGWWRAVAIFGIDH